MIRRQLVLVCALMLLWAGAAEAVTALQKCPTCRSFYSESLGAVMEYRVFLPPDYAREKARRYPVIIFLHGYDFVRNKPGQSAPQEGVNHWMDQEQLGPIATCLMTVKDYDNLGVCLRGMKLNDPDGIVDAMRAEYPENPLPLPPMIIVMPDGSNSFYVNRRDGKKLYPPLNGPEYVDGIRAGATGMFEDYIVKDLVSHVDKTYRAIPDRARRGIGGFSMGGLGAMNLLLRRPDVFCSVTSLSAIFTLKEMLTDPIASEFMLKSTQEAKDIFSVVAVPGKKPKVDVDYLKQYDPVSLLDGFQRADVRIYFDAGAGDFFSGRDNFSTFTVFDKALKAKGLQSHPANHVIPGNEHNRNGLHTALYWRSRVGVILKFHADSFAQFAAGGMK